MQRCHSIDTADSRWGRRRRRSFPLKCPVLSFVCSLVLHVTRSCSVVFCVSFSSLLPFSTGNYPTTVGKETPRWQLLLIPFYPNNLCSAGSSINGGSLQTHSYSGLPHPCPRALCVSPETTSISKLSLFHLLIIRSHYKTLISLTQSSLIVFLIVGSISHSSDFSVSLCSLFNLTWTPIHWLTI